MNATNKKKKNHNSLLNPYEYIYLNLKKEIKREKSNILQHVSEVFWFFRKKSIDFYY